MDLWVEKLRDSRQPEISAYRRDTSNLSDRFFFNRMTSETEIFERKANIRPEVLLRPKCKHRPSGSNFVHSKVPPLYLIMTRRSEMNGLCEPSFRDAPGRENEENNWGIGTVASLGDSRIRLHIMMLPVGKAS